MSGAQTVAEFAFEKVIADICDFDWPSLDEASAIDVVWCYYFFSVQFRENLQVARSLHPEDEKLKDLEREECDTNNLSPWPGVAGADERMDHDEFIKRVLSLATISEAKRRRFENSGQRYLREIRELDATSRAMSITSYEDGGLERVFRAMLTSPQWQNPLLSGFRHFVSEHIRFDSDASQGHGAMIRHLRPDDRILPLWISFKDLLVEFVPALSLSGHGR